MVMMRFDTSKYVITEFFGNAKTPREILDDLREDERLAREQGRYPEMVTGPFITKGKCVPHATAGEGKIWTLLYKRDQISHPELNLKRALRTMRDEFRMM